MNKRIHLMPVAEPREFHPGVAGGSRVYAVQLSLDVSDAKESDAQGFFEQHLKLLPTSRFVRLVFRQGPGQEYELVIGDTVVANRTFDTPEPDPKLGDWLLKYRDGRDKALENEPFFVTKQREVADFRNICASELLRSAWRWPAPLAQRAGLVTAVSVPQADHMKDRLEFLVPLLNVELNAVAFTLQRSAPGGPAPGGETGAQTPSATENAGSRLKGALYDIRVSAPGGEEYTVETLDLNALQESRLADFEPDGLFKQPTIDEATFRLYARVEQRAASLLYAPMNWVRAAQGEEGLFSDAAMFGWLARSAALMCFDVVVAGLLLPVSNTKDGVKRRGPVLERLTRRIAARIEEEKPAVDVDEEVLYGALHSRLRTVLQRRTPKEIWCSVESAFERRGFEKRHIHAALNGSEPSPADSRLTQLEEELQVLTEFLGSEAGGESWLKNVLKDLAPQAPVPRDQHGPYESLLPHTTLERLQADFDAFVGELDSSWNASESLRGAFGAEAVLAIITNCHHDVDRRERMRASAPLVGRLALENEPKGVFDDLWSFAFPIEEVPKEHRESVRALAKGALKANLEALSSDPEKETSFRPDDRPLPLLLPIADRPNLFAEEGTVESISGLAFLVQHGPAHDPVGEWKTNVAHASLIRLLPGPESDAGVLTVDPVLPLPAPGTAGLVIAYTGTPLSSPNQVAPMDGGQSSAEAERQRQVDRVRRFVKGDAEYGGEGKPSPVPDVAYGIAYRICTFWEPPSGVLPPALRDGDPFTPKAPDVVGSRFWPKADGGTWLCQRRTAISAAGLQVAPTRVAPYTIPKDLEPLSSDDPRVVLSASRHVDLWRGIGGVGLLSPGAQTLILRNVECVGGEPQEVVRASAMEGTQNDGTPLRVAYGDHTITLTVPPGKDPKGTWWARLEIVRAEFGTGSPVVSFSDPQAGQDATDGRTSPDRSAVPLLLAPQPVGWTMPAKQTVVIDVPRVSFEDFERWAANANLWRHTCGVVEVSDKRPENLLGALREARALFEETGHPYKDYKEKLNALPDPAVSGILLSLSVTHTMSQHDGPRHAEERVDGGPYRNVLQMIPAEPADRLPPVEWYKRLVDTILSNARIEVTLEPKELGSFKTESRQRLGLNLEESTIQLSAGVPKGHVALLRVLPRVREEHFDPAAEKEPLRGIFHPRMREFSVGKDGDCLLFDGPSRSIEVMSEPGEMVLPNLTIRQIGTERAFAVDCHLNDPEYRLFSQAELITQRWRFERPIVSWIDVADRHGVDGAGRQDAGPVVPIVFKEAMKEFEVAVKEFEEEAFWKRDDADAGYAAARLRPETNSTPAIELRRFDWPEPSATYFRHRVKLLSRYRGAMESPAKGVKSGNDWTARVAVLAEPDMVTLIRPQIRAFFPLQRRMSGEPWGPTPVSCVLSEPPYAQLGLAERIEAELVVKPTFGKPQGKEQFEMASLRKEISPDPLLSYTAIGDEPSRRARVRVSGPAGRHIDAVSTSAPKYAYSQYLLQVELPETSREDKLGDKLEFEEVFASIVLTRRADARWSYYRGRSTEIGLQESWLEIGAAEITLYDGPDPARQSTCVAKISKTEVKIRGSAIHPGGGDSLVDVWTNAPGKSEDSVAVLLKPLADMRYRLSIYERVGDGGYRLITAVTVVTTGPLRASNPSPSTRPAAQSEATLPVWVRSTRDFCTLAVREDSASAWTPYPVRALEVRLRQDWGGLDWNLDGDPVAERAVPVRSPAACRAYPLHTQRRLVMIVREASSQLGEEVHLYKSALLADDWGARSSRLKTPSPEGLSVVVAELECPSEIALISDSPQLKEAMTVDPRLGYRVARFDLPSRIRAGTAGTVRQLLFHIRAAGAALNLASLRLGVGKERSENPQPLSGHLETSADALTVIVYQGQGGVCMHYRARSRGTGELVTGPIEVVRDGYENLVDLLTWHSKALGSDQGEQPSIVLTIADASTDERWVDASMLHSRRAFAPDDSEPDAFDFDWVLGTEEDEDRELPDAVSPGVLNRLPEAQARLLGVTDPITVKRSAP